MSDALARGRFDQFEPIARVKLELRADVELNQLQELIAELYKNSGCAPCGRLSFTIEAIDQELVLPALKGLREHEMVKNITVG
jgi:hypothetical protein